MSIVMGIIIFVTGIGLGMIVGFISVGSTFPVIGTLHVDMSRDAKNIYRFEFEAEPEDYRHRKLVFLRMKEDTLESLTETQEKQDL